MRRRHDWSLLPDAFVPGARRPPKSLISCSCGWSYGSKVTTEEAFRQFEAHVTGEPPASKPRPSKARTAWIARLRRVLPAASVKTWASGKVLFPVTMILETEWSLYRRMGGPKPLARINRETGRIVRDKVSSGRR
jgi:hypothetical protein